MPVKKLHRAKSMKDLETQTELKFQKTFAAYATTKLVNSAEKLFKDAEEKYLDKDEEVAYVQFVRFIELILELKKKPDFTKHKNHKLLLLYANTALSKAETLKESLLKRYSEADSIEKEKNSNVVSVQKNISEITTNVSVEPMEIPPEKLNNEQKLSISSSELFSMLQTNTSSIIIMDIRPAEDFEKSHIKYSRCISVPQELLHPGVTAAKLESLLPEESLAQFFKRKEADFIILVDWDSKDENTENVLMNSLKAAITKWDKSSVSNNALLILRGGYKDWMRKYPMCTTQPLSFDLISDVKTSPVIADLSAIEYPNLDENVNEVEIMNEKNTNMLFKKSTLPATILNGVSPTSNYRDLRKPYSAPAVDRKSKPNSENVLKPSNIENRSNKSHSANNRNSESVGAEKIVPPPVDRNLKNIICSPGADKNSSLDNNVLDSYNKEQLLTKEKLEIMNNKLRKEEEFEKLRLRKALEAEETKNIEIQKQEELILQKLKQLEVLSKEKEDELLKVKEENKKIKILLDEKIDLELKREKEKEINNTLMVQTSLREKVERAREERKRVESLKKKTQNPLPRETASANPVLRRTDNVDKPVYTSANSTEYTVPLARSTSTCSDASRGLVRSHSSPNIAQMMNDEECAEYKTPVVDRSLKPKVNVTSPLGEINRARLRNLNPVYGSPVVRPATGLRNLGNTCFMNSVIQCLSNTLPLAEYITNGLYVDHINRDSRQGTGGELIEEFAVVIKSLWMGQYKSFYPREFKNIVSKSLAVCIGNEQQDSHEFLVVLMEKLHADLNKKNSKNVPKLDPNCNETSFWQHHKAYNSSKISDIFDGLMKSTLTCLSCRKTSDSFEVFSCLSLPILSSRCSLKECFQHFLRAEKISGEAAWDCPRCKQKKEAEKRLRICRTPEVLIIQLKRFSYEGLWRRKLQTVVDFDLSFEVPFEVNSYESYRMYSLYGIVNHYGTLEGGHYTAFCKNNSGRWFKYDDHEVNEISTSDVKTPAAYLLFYISSDFQSRL